MRLRAHRRRLSARCWRASGCRISSGGRAAAAAGRGARRAGAGRVLAALSPASIRLAGELADGWAPFLWARSRAAQRGGPLAAGGRSARGAAGGRRRISVGRAGRAWQPTSGAHERLAAWWLVDLRRRAWGRCTRGCSASASGWRRACGARGRGRAGQPRAGAAGRGRGARAATSTLLGDLRRRRRGRHRRVARGRRRPACTSCCRRAQPEEELAAIVDVAGRLARLSGCG